MSRNSLVSRETVRAALTCQTCGKQFTVRGNRRAKFCSKDCHYRREDIERARECLFCGETFRAVNKGTRYCSKSCSNRGRSQNKRYKPHNLPNDWKKLRAIVIKRDGDTCQKCGKNCAGDRSKHIHHIFDRLHNDPKDLVLLCATCHQQVTTVEQGLRLLQEQGANAFRPFVGLLQGGA